VIRFIKTILPLILLLILLVIAVIGFSFFEDLNNFEALWMTVTTVLTVGYGDLIPQTHEGRVLAIVLVPLCIILFTYFMGMIIGFIVEFNISTVKRSQRMERKIKHMRNHIIVCGLNPISLIIIDRIKQDRTEFVLVEPDESKCEQLIESHNIVIGDPGEDDVLRRAGIEKANGLITTGSDAENVLTILSAREMNPEVRITSSAERVESESKLMKAGANRVINPEHIGGTRMALSILKPAAVDYMDRMFTSETDSFRIEELFLTDGSNLISETIKTAELRTKYDISVLGIKREGHVYASKIADLVLKTNDVMIIFGKEPSILKLKLTSMSDVL